MTKSEIRIFAHKQTLGTGKATAKYAGDTVNYIKVHFNLDENWDGYDSIRAVWANKATISTLLDSNNDCVIPFEVLANKGDVIVNLVASKVENGEVTDRFTSYPFVACSITADVVLNGSETAPITPSQFEQFVETVKEDADRAEASADDAEQSASASASSASQASEHAHEAEISAERAETAKDDAETARDEILGMRATANTLPSGSDATASYADGLLTLGIPRGDTGEVSLAMLNAMFASALPTDTASGSIASFPDGTDILPAISVLDSIEPIQDLHGYDKPWSGGNGKNKLNNTAESATINGVAFTVYSDGTVNANGTATDDADLYIFRGLVLPSGNYILNGCPSGGSTSTYRIFGTNIGSDVGTGIAFTANGSTAVTVKINIKSGTAVSNLKFSPMIRLASESEATFSPYSNICPISGRTEVVTSRVGKNLFDQNDTTYLAKDARAFGASDDRALAQINTLPAGTYTLSFIEKIVSLNGIEPNEAKFGLYLRATSGGQTFNVNAQSALITFTVGQIITKSVTFTLTDEFVGKFQYFYVYTGKNTPAPEPNIYTANIYDVQIELGSTATDYEAFDGTSYTTALGRTVYGGTLDVVSGVLTVDMKFDQMTYAYLSGLSSSNIGYVANVSQVGGNAVWVRNWNYTDYPATVAGGIKAFCNAFPISMHDKNMFASQYRTYFGIGSNTSVDAFLASVQALEASGDGLWIAHELATPQTIQLTPQEVALLKGQNNLWRDSGNIEVTYKADIQKYIEKKLG